MLKIININKPYNIFKKLKGCLNCHKIKSSNNYKRINIINYKVKNLYKNLKNIKNFKIFNMIMNNILVNLKNRYILDISRYFNKILLLKKKLFIIGHLWRW